MKHDKPPTDWKELNSRPRVSAAIRNALAIHVAQGILPTQAARAAGVREATMLAALERPHVQQVLQKIREQHQRQIEALEQLMHGEAVQQAIALMRTAKSEQVRMRAIEFFRDATKPNGSVPGRKGPKPKPAAPSPAYAYAKPTDDQSAGLKSQAPVAKAKKPDE